MDAIIAISGVIDIVADSKDAYVIYNGHKIMSKSQVVVVCYQHLLQLI